MFVGRLDWWIYEVIMINKGDGSLFGTFLTHHVPLPLDLSDGRPLFMHQYGVIIPPAQ